MTETFYDVLGVTPDASTADIRAAYRARLKETHPDVSDDADASEATQRLIEARDVLTDADERARYDRLGHEAYVSGESARTGDGSTVSAAARQAGYGGDATDAGADADRSDGQTSTDETGKRGRSRAERERRADERVAEERNRRSTDGATGEEAAGAADTATANDASRTGDGWNRGTAATSGSGGDGVWSASSTYSVRQRASTGGRRRFEMPTGRELTLFGITFALYPVLLFSALLPAFPLWVNVVIGLCTVMLVGYLQSEPVIAIGVFGSWSLATAVALLVLNVGPLSLLGLLALAGTWLPFGFSLLTAAALRV
ncbi:J domain-containing protein [Haloarcula salina]|uniref:J domain-containing protein n=1 Tax=Haloarcula salina TaxID=1429914 RepID=UPI003C703459